jgi:hypothetical protein
MIKARAALARQAFRFAMAGIAASCLGAAVFAAPMTLTPKSKLDAAREPVAQKSFYSSLTQGPAFQLAPAGEGEDEDCVRVVRMTGPDGRIYVTRGLICAD